MIVNKMELPTAPGGHFVDLDGHSAEMLRGLANAWNQRVVLTQSRRLTIEQDRPEVRRIIERDMLDDLQIKLSEQGLTALWVQGPAWHQTTERMFPNGPVHDCWVCEIRALCLPMSAWDGASWAPGEEARS